MILVTKNKRHSTPELALDTALGDKVLNKDKGFTLIELLVVLSIVAVLAVMIMSSIQTSRQRAYDAQIKNDMIQVQTALELYAHEHNYTYPLLSELVSVTPGGQKNKSIAIGVFEKLSDLFVAKKAYATGGRDQNCLYFDNLVNVLAPYIGTIPHHPLDNGTDVCYRYFATDAGDSAVAYGSLVTEKYSGGINKQIGIAVGKTDMEALQNICNANLNSSSFGGLGEGSSPFPFFSGGSDHCSGTIADTVLGITSGEGDVTVVSSCSLSQYGTEEDCERDYSYCSDSQYTSAGPETCVANGTTVAGYCQDHSEYANQSDCVNAGYYSGQGCSSGGYTDRDSCVGAGYMTSGSCSGGSQYADHDSCVNASYPSGSGGCSNSSYYDQSSCEGAQCFTGWAYCSNGGYYDHDSCVGAGFQAAYCQGDSQYTSQETCQGAQYVSSQYCPDGVSSTAQECSDNGYQWVMEYANYGYQWIPEYSGYGYQWYGDQYASCGYTWTNPTNTSYNYTWNDGQWFSYNYTWYDGWWMSSNYQWVPGSFTSNYWTSVTSGVWSTY